MTDSHPIPVGFCQCGCGLPAPIATMTSKRYGVKVGEPFAYRQNHRKRVPLDIRFWAKVRKQDGDGCWEWTGASRGGKVKSYGTIRINHHNRFTHRVSWEMVNGPVPEGLCVLHRCDNPPCVRPDHLFLGTHKDNMTDAVQKGRRVAGNNDWLRKNPGVFTGERNNSAKLTLEKVALIRSLYAAGGVKYTELADKFGVGKSAIGYVITGHTWIAK